MQWQTDRLSTTQDTIGLLLVDEVHMLGDTRGACLEGLITRCKVMKAFKKDVDVPCARMRFVALSRRHINFHRCRRECLQ
jgi:replicative superfamily II helicase